MRDGPTTSTALSPDSGVHWTNEGPWEVADNVFRLPVPLPMDGLKAVNIYVLRDQGTVNLIDGGWAVEECRRQLERQLGRLGIRAAEIERILVTHAHRDHYTLAATLASEGGPEVWLGEGDRRTIDRAKAGVTEKTDPTAEVLRVAGAEELSRDWYRLHDPTLRDKVMWRTPDHWMEGDEEIDVGSRSLTAVHTPGHTAGHYVFADIHDELLFSGDHVLPTITPSVGFELVVAPLPLGDFLQSLARVRDLPDLRLLPAHGPIAPSSHARAGELVAFHEIRLSDCLRLVDGIPATAHIVAGGLGWTRHEHPFEQLDQFNRSLACMETMFHLDLLAARGDVTRTDDAGVARYALPTRVDLP